MSLNPTVYLLLAVYGLIFLGTALLVYWLARKTWRTRPGSDDSPGAEPERPRAPALATLATVSLAGSADEAAEPAPRRFRFVRARAQRPNPLSSDSDDGAAILNLHIQVDALLLQRLSEFLQSRGESQSEPDGDTEGCVIVIADALPPATAAVRGSEAAYLSGAGAALSLARALAEAPGRAFHTLLIDTGSPAWSIYGIDTSAATEAGGGGESDEDEGEPLRTYTAPDIVPLPEEIPGVYDVIAGRITLDDCLLSEEDAPLLTALAPGEMPLRWTELLRSAGMRRLLGASRTLAEVVLVYAPRIAEYPEQTRQLAEWADGVIVIGAELGRGANEDERERIRAVAEFEQAASQVLETSAQNSLAPLLGRIALDFTSAKDAAPLGIAHDSTPK